MRSAPRPAAMAFMARREGKPLDLASGIVAALGALLALLLVALFVVLDYHFGQAPHRLVKILVGVGLMVGIVVQPRVGLFLIPVITPFLPWIPPLDVPGVNPLNVLLGSVFLTWVFHRVLQRGPVLR